MESLPHEVLCNIASFLPKTLDTGNASESLPSPGASDERPGILVRPGIASLSRAWQSAIETITFREIHIKSNQPELETFKGALSDLPRCSHRRRALRKLHYDVVLPVYNDQSCAEYETDEDRKANDDVFTKGVSELVQHLSKWPAECRLVLALDVYSPMDYRVQPDEIREKRNRFQRTVELGRREDLKNDRYLYSYLSLRSPLPTVSCIDSLSGANRTRALHPSTQVALIAACPRLRSVSFNYAEPDQFMPLRRQLRQDLTASLETFELSPETRTLHFAIAEPTIRHDLKLADFTDPELHHDPLCSRLRTIIGNSKLQVLNYDGMVDAALFWPPSHDGAEQDKPWAGIKDVWINFDMASPSGQWYFKAKPGDPYSKPESDEPLPRSARGYWPPGYGTAEQTVAALAFQRSLQPRVDGDGLGNMGDDFRQMPNDDAMMPLLEAVAQRIADMPSLESWYMATEIPQTSSEWFLTYSAAGKTTGYEDCMDEAVLDEGQGEIAQLEAGSRAHVLFHVGDWRPTRQVLDLFRKAGGAEDAIVAFLPYLY